jgi:hypothetical protein
MKIHNHKKAAIIMLQLHKLAKRADLVANGQVTAWLNAG